MYRSLKVRTRSLRDFPGQNLISFGFSDISGAPAPFCVGTDSKIFDKGEYQVILEPGIGQFREFEPRRVHTRINSLGLFVVHKLTCGKRESVS